LKEDCTLLESALEKDPLERSRKADEYGTSDALTNHLELLKLTSFQEPAYYCRLERIEPKGKL
jgi:hypothetical protein